MDNSQINKTLESLEAGYNRIAMKFSDTRKFFWRDLEFIADYVDSGDKVLDFGCGNGRLLKIIKNKTR
ncbi:MAG TPA: methionine biosynthesis protein MetW [Candidatus Moranbacteria bacterium]|nr:methionine biosynthesis protein MetW [Candidatus Moranbacteria bacterium]